MRALTTEQTDTNLVLKSGPSLLEVEYLRQIQEELAIFLRGSSCTTLKDIVLGVRGTTYQGVIPINGGNNVATV